MNTGKGCPEVVESPSWRNLRPNWMGPQAICFSWSWEVGLDDLQRSLPTSAILQVPAFDDSSQRFVPFSVFRAVKFSIVYSQLMEVLQDLHVQRKTFWGRFFIFFNWRSWQNTCLTHQQAIVLKETDGKTGYWWMGKSEKKKASEAHGVVGSKDSAFSCFL